MCCWQFPPGAEQHACGHLVALGRIIDVVCNGFHWPKTFWNLRFGTYPSHGLAKRVYKQAQKVILGYPKWCDITEHVIGTSVCFLASAGTDSLVVLWGFELIYALLWAYESWIWVNHAVWSWFWWQPCWKWSWLWRNEMNWSETMLKVILVSEKMEWAIMLNWA